MRKGQSFLIVIAAFVVGLAGAWVLPNIHSANTEKPVAKESAYERVMRTQTIRCGYVVWTPALIKDANSGQLSGIFHDYVESLGQSLHLKIEWAEEMGWSDFPAALQSGRIDAMCGGSFPNSARARVIDFTRPIFYQPMLAFSRADDARFDNNIDAINDPSITIVSVEGATTSVVAAQDFPKAKNMQLPEMTSMAEIFVNLAGGKGDVAIAYPLVAVDYDKQNPGKIKRIQTNAPVRLFGTGIAINGGEDRFRRMLDLGTDEMLYSGQIEKIISKYVNSPDALLRVASPVATHSSP